MKTLQNICAFMGTLLSVTQEKSDLLFTLEHSNGEKDVFIHRVEDVAERDIITEQAQKFLLGKNILIIGDHLTVINREGVNIPIIYIEEIRFVGKTFREAVREAANKVPLGISLKEVTQLTDLEDWFKEIYLGLWDERYKVVKAGKDAFPIYRGTTIEDSAVQVKLASPKGDIELLAVNQSSKGVDTWAEKASTGVKITWFAFKFNAAPGVVSHARLGRVESGKWVANEGYTKTLVDLFSTTPLEEIAESGIEALTVPETVVKNANDLLAQTTLEFVQGKS